jgi:serine/threonine protein kinase
MTGEKILNYKIENLTEENQLYRSFLATHTQFAKQVIIKTLKPLDNPIDKVDLIQEIRKLASLQHPNIITFYDHLESSTGFYLIFEHIDGTTLSDYIHKTSGPIPEPKAIDLFLEILDAFVFAHQKGINNGAISPANIILTQNQHIKVLDLALSKFYNQKMLDTDDRETLFYHSPQQLEGDIKDFRNDIYGLGVLLFQMLTGTSPDENLPVEAIKKQIREQNLPSMQSIYPAITPEIQKIVDKATAKKPDERFQSLESFKQAVLAIREIKFTQTNLAKQTESKISPKESQDIAQRKFINVPLIALIILGSIATIFVVQFYLGQSAVSTELTRPSLDAQRVKEKQDSIATAQKSQAIEDSIRVFGSIYRKDTMMTHYYKIEKKSEKLSDIAKRFYVPIDSLRKLNDLRGKEIIKKGEGIKIRVRDIYSLRKEETLYDVEKKYGVSSEILKVVNQLYPKAPEPGELPQPVIFEGKQLVIPLIYKEKK